MFWIALALFSSLAAVEIPAEVGDLQIELTDPTLKSNILRCTEGGIIQSDAFRLQAKTIIYDKNSETIEAKNDLMLIYDKRLFIGDSFYYDLKQKKGVLTHGKTYDNLWIVGGKTIHFAPDRSVTIDDAFMTASETDPPDYALKAKEIKLDESSQIAAKKVQFQFKKVPLFYLPFFQMNMREMRDARIRYSARVIEKQGFFATMRYNFFSNEDLDLFLRLTLRTSRGLSGAFESDYHSILHDLNYRTKNYLGHDTFWNDKNPNKKRTRWRVQGDFDFVTPNKMTSVEGRYDWISDRNLIDDMPTDNFEFQTSKKTELMVNHIDPIVVTDGYFQPRINSFQGFKQDLPTVNLAFHPLQLGPTKMVMENNLSTSFLEYEFPKDEFHHISPFRSFRFQTDQKIYRPFDFSFLSITPHVAYKGVGYSNSPEERGVMANIVEYGAQASTHISRRFNKMGHIMTPYAKFDSFHPIKMKDHYIFDLRDGFEKIDELKVGVQNELYILKHMEKPRFNLDLYALRFFNTPQLTGQFSKLGAEVALNFPSFSIGGNLLYNDIDKVFDEANVGTKWTMNRYFAVGLDYFHRSKYAYRKVDHHNYMLDVTRSAEDLLSTPISDQRNLFLSKLELQLPPNWTLRTRWELGWARGEQPAYSIFRVDLIRMLDSRWKMRFSYIKRTNTPAEWYLGASLIQF